MNTPAMARPMPSRRPVVGVMGGHVSDRRAEALAEELGRRIGEAGWFLLNGGRDQGVMAAAARGCRAGGGFSVGIHPGGSETDDVAPDLDLVIRTGMGYGRNHINILSSDVVVALPGGPGTLNEVAYARIHDKPTILLGFDDKDWFQDRVQRADDVDDAMERIRKALGDRA